MATFSAAQSSLAVTPHERTSGSVPAAGHCRPTVVARIVAQADLAKEAAVSRVAQVLACARAGAPRSSRSRGRSRTACGAERRISPFSAAATSSTSISALSPVAGFPPHCSPHGAVPRAADRGIGNDAQRRWSSYCATASGSPLSCLHTLSRSCARSCRMDSAQRLVEVREDTLAFNVLKPRTNASATRGAGVFDKGGPMKKIKSKRNAQIDVMDEEAGGSSSMKGRLLPREEAESNNGMTWEDLKFIILPFLFPALGGFLFGYDIGATSDAILSLKSAALSGVSWYDLNALQTGLVVSGSLGGALVGSILAYLIADAIGRRLELILSASLFVLGALLQAGAPDLGFLAIGRLVYGTAIGLAMHGAPMYIAETAPAAVRGTLVSLKEGFIVAGILAGYFVGYETIELVGGWRWMFGAAAPIAIVMGLGMVSLPRSPRWLLLRALRDPSQSNSPQSGARAALCALRGNTSAKKIDDEMADMLGSMESAVEGGDSVSWRELLQGTSLKALIIGTGLVFFQQVTGQPSVLYYAATILKSAGFEAASDATEAAVIIGVFKLMMTGIAIGTVDKVGRRPLLLFGVTGMVVSLFLLAFFIEGGSADISVIALLLYVGCYQISFGPISWLMVSEVFPLRVRGRALSIATLVNFAANAVVTFGLPPVQDRLGAGNSFLVFGIIGVLALAFVALVVPETKGLSLEEIEAKLRNS